MGIILILFGLAAGVGGIIGMGVSPLEGKKVGFRLNVALWIIGILIWGLGGLVHSIG